jgi:hypothetical protein
MGDEARQEPLPQPAGDGPVRVGAWGQLTPAGPAVLLVLGEHRLLLAAADVRLLALRMLDEAHLAQTMESMVLVGLSRKTVRRAANALIRQAEQGKG